MSAETPTTVIKLANLVLDKHNMSGGRIRHIKSSGNEHLFFVDNDFVLRLTDTDTATHLERLRQVSHLEQVPALYSSGLADQSLPYNYILCRQLRGLDYIETVRAMSEAENRRLGRAIAAFMDRLHNIPGQCYDIGHYVPIVGQHAGSWLTGHQQYWVYMQNKLKQVALDAGQTAIFNEAFGYLKALQSALSFQKGPVLLHNDLHPKNIIVDSAALSGIIDWECAQYGEADFELCHVIHWCVYPPAAGIDLRPFLFAMLAARPACSLVPRLADRLTIYQIEHEIMQIIWSGGKALDERLPKLRNWMDGQVASLLTPDFAGY